MQNLCLPHLKSILTLLDRAIVTCLIGDGAGGGGAQTPTDYLLKLPKIPNSETCQATRVLIRGCGPGVLASNSSELLRDCLLLGSRPPMTHSVPSSQLVPGTQALNQ